MLQKQIAPYEFGNYYTLSEFKALVIRFASPKVLWFVLTYILSELILQLKLYIHKMDLIPYINVFLKGYDNVSNAIFNLFVSY